MEMAISHSVVARILLASLLTVSCSDEGSGPRVPPTAGTSNANGTTCIDLTAPTSWQGGIGTVFQNNCGSCHPGSRPTDYNSYPGVTAGISVVLMRIDAGTMPVAGPLSAADSSAIHAWVAAGLPEFDSAAPAGPGSSTGTAGGGTTTPTSCPSTTAQVPATAPGTPAPAAPAAPPVVVPALEPTYALGVEPIMSAYCSGCHSAAGGTTPYLDTYASVKSNYRNIMSQVNSAGMPVPRTATSKLPADKLDILTKWGSNPNAPYGQYAP